MVKGVNELFYRIENYPIDLMRVRDDDIPTFVGDGVADLGIVGRNVLAEHAGDEAPAEIMQLGFGRCALKLAAVEGFSFDGPASLQGQRIATTYPHVLSRYLAQNGVAAEIVPDGTLLAPQHLFQNRLLGSIDPML